jgi:hypothetical protein
MDSKLGFTDGPLIGACLSPDKVPHQFLETEEHRAVPPAFRERQLQPNFPDLVSNPNAIPPNIVMTPPENERSQIGVTRRREQRAENFSRVAHYLTAKLSPLYLQNIRLNGRRFQRLILLTTEYRSNQLISVQAAHLIPAAGVT